MINRITILTILITSFLAFNVIGQNISIEDLLISVEAKNNVDIDTVRLCDFYVFDGVHFSSEDINSELKNYKKEDIKLTQIVNLTTTPFNNNCDFLILFGTGENQSNKDKKKMIKEIQNNLNSELPQIVLKDVDCEKCKRLTVDGKLLGLYEAKEFVNEIKIKDIEYIATYDSANPLYYGQGAENGLIEIYLNK